MSFKSGLKATFNWLAQRPDRNYTLTEAYQHFVQKKPWDQINGNPLGYSRAGRAAERAFTALGITATGIVLITAPILPAAALGAYLIALTKTAGIGVGKTIDQTIRGKGSISLLRGAFIDYKESKAQLQINRALPGKHFKL